MRNNITRSDLDALMEYLRQLYLRHLVPADHYKDFPETEHIHSYGYYIGNYPDLSDAEIDEICAVVNAA